MKKTKKNKILYLLYLLSIFLIGSSFQFPHNDYIGIHGIYNHQNDRLLPYPYRIKLTFSGNSLHRLETDYRGNIKVDKQYSGGSSTSNGTRTLYKEKEANGTEILVGVQGSYITIDTNLEHGVFQYHIRWEKSH